MDNTNLNKPTQNMEMGWDGMILSKKTDKN